MNPPVDLAAVNAFLVAVQRGLERYAQDHAWGEVPDYRLELDQTQLLEPGDTVKLTREVIIPYGGGVEHDNEYLPMCYVLGDEDGIAAYLAAERAEQERKDREAAEHERQKLELRLRVAEEDAARLRVKLGKEPRS